jgi:hypothetical protein
MKPGWSPDTKVTVEEQLDVAKLEAEYQPCNVAVM